MSLAINYIDEQHPKEIHITSLEQIVGRHLKIFELGNEEFHNAFMRLNKTRPDKYKLHQNFFTVKAPNNSDITHSMNGNSPWFLVRGVKGVHKSLSLLFMGQNLWGIEISMGAQLRKNSEKVGKEKIIDFLCNQVKSILKEPEKWMYVSGYCI
jgi:hypothetical protein